MTATILIIEDDPAIRRGVVDGLRSTGYDALEAGDGESGLRLALDEPVDLILLDLALPRRDGLDQPSPSALPRDPVPRRQEPRIEGPPSASAASPSGARPTLEIEASNQARLGTERLSLRIETLEDTVVLDWRDHGPGIPPAVRRRIFRPFHRRDPGSEGGLGLGLALSRRVARRWGGDLRVVTPTDGPGVCLRLRLRRAV